MSTWRRVLTRVLGLWIVLAIQGMSQIPSMRDMPGMSTAHQQAPAPCHHQHHQCACCDCCAVLARQFTLPSAVVLVLAATPVTTTPMPCPVVDAYPPATPQVTLPPPLGPPTSAC